MTNPFPVKPLHPLAEILTARSISAEEAVKMNMARHTADQISDYVGHSIPSWLQGTFLPYHDLDGSPLLTEERKLFCRWRMETITGKPLPEGTKRYKQPGGSGVAVYLPLATDINWIEVAHDTSVEIWVTEGEFKAIRACQEGMVCIGLGGVDNWREKSGKLARPFNMFLMEKRVVNIVYDADESSTADAPLKPMVESAFQRITARLGELGARTNRVSIAMTDTFLKARILNPECKMGIDDFFKAGGRFEELLLTIQLVSHNQDAARLLREYAIYQGKKAHIVRLSDGAPFPVGEFAGLIEANAVTVRFDPIAKRQIKIKEHEAWRESKNQLRIVRYVFDPASNAGYDSQERTYNVWKGWAVKGLVGDGEGELYNQVVADWRKFLKGIFGEWDWYFEKWLAHMLQFPSVKTSIAILIATKLNGVGKTLLGEIIVDLCGNGVDGAPDNAIALELDRVVGSNFNALLRGRMFVQIDEADGRFSGHESKLKDLITSDMVPIEFKGMDTVMVKNFSRIFLTSNSIVPIRMDDQNRRYLVIQPDMTQEHAKTIWEPWVSRVIGGGVRKSEHGLRMLRWHLDRVDLTGWDPQARVPVTEAMMDLVQSSVTKKAEVSDRLLEALFEDEVGFWALTGELRSRDKVLWGELIASLRLAGGVTCTHVIKVANKSVRVVLLDPHARLPRKQDRSTEWTLYNLSAGLTGAQVTAACSRAAVAYDKWKGVVMPDTKYS